MGSTESESHFNLNFQKRDKVTRQCPQTTTFQEKGEPKQIRTEVLPLTARPNRLTEDSVDRQLWRGANKHPHRCAASSRPSCTGDVVLLVCEGDFPWVPLRSVKKTASWHGDRFWSRSLFCLSQTKACCLQSLVRCRHEITAECRVVVSSQRCILG